MGFGIQLVLERMRDEDGCWVGVASTRSAPGFPVLAKSDPAFFYAVTGAPALADVLRRDRYDFTQFSFPPCPLPAMPMTAYGLPDNISALANDEYEDFLEDFSEGKHTLAIKSFLDIRPFLFAYIIFSHVAVIQDCPERRVFMERGPATSGEVINRMLRSFFHMLFGIFYDFADENPRDQYRVVYWIYSNDPQTSGESAQTPQTSS